jgi:hypothetical protein
MGAVVSKPIPFRTSGLADAAIDYDWICKAGLGPFFTHGEKGSDQTVFLRSRGVLAQHALYGGCRDAMAFGDLAKALAALAVSLDSGMVELQQVAADVLLLLCSLNLCFLPKIRVRSRC